MSERGWLIYTCAISALWGVAVYSAYTLGKMRGIREERYRRAPKLSISIEIAASCDDPKAWAVIQSVADFAGLAVPQNSGWHVELPRAVMHLLVRDGELAARAMVARCFAESSTLAAAQYLEQIQ